MFSVPYTAETHSILGTFHVPRLFAREARFSIQGKLGEPNMYQAKFAFIEEALQCWHPLKFFESNKK